MSDQALLDAFNAADTWEAVLAAIDSINSDLLNDDHRDNLAILSNSEGGAQAVGLGILEYKDLFEGFTSVDELLFEVVYRIDAEYEKYLALKVINEVKSESIGLALAIHIQFLHGHRQELIQRWSSSGDPDAEARAAELADEEYTLVLAGIYSNINNEVYFAQLAAKILTARESGSLTDITALIHALETADAEIEADAPLLEAFNTANTWEDALAAIEDNASALLDTDHLGKLIDLREDDVREQAVGNGIVEIKTLFDAFTSVEELISAVRQQIDIEHTIDPARVILKSTANRSSLAG